MHVKSSSPTEVLLAGIKILPLCTFDSVLCTSAMHRKASKDVDVDLWRFEMANS